jgi:hypothetical protein
VPVFTLDSFNVDHADVIKIVIKSKTLPRTRIAVLQQKGADNLKKGTITYVKAQGGERR